MTKTTNTFAILAVGLLLSGCGGGNPAPTKADAAPAPLQRPTPNAAAQQSPAVAANTANTAAIVAPPAGANFTIWCRAISGPAHVEQAKSLKEYVISKSGLRDWYIIHGDDQSTIYYGFYKQFNDPRGEPVDTRRAKADHAAIGKIVDQVQEPIFRGALFVPIDAPDPDSPPEWDLTRVGRDKAEGDPTRPFWSVMIASYTGSADRKRYAVEAVKDARARGIPAFYFHGEAVSSVCVGVWPRSAVKEQQAAAGNARNPNERLMVTNVPLPDEVTERVVDRENKRVSVLQPRIEITDATLTKTMNDYPIFSVNGLSVPRTLKDRNGNDVTQELPSTLIQIPTGLVNPSAVAGQPDDPNSARLLSPNNRNSQGGRLRSVNNP